MQSKFRKKSKTAEKEWCRAWNLLRTYMQNPVAYVGIVLTLNCDSNISPNIILILILRT